MPKAILYNSLENECEEKQQTIQLFIEKEG